jgi:hypothetical protein
MKASVRSEVMNMSSGVQRDPPEGVAQRSAGKLVMSTIE